MKIKWQKKQIRNNKTKKLNIESMRKQKLTRKTMVIFRFCLLIVQVYDFMSSLC